MGDGFEVDSGKLTEHAEQVRGIAGAAAAVPDAGAAVTPAGLDLAYGVMFQWWPQGTRPVSTFLINSATDIVAALNSTAELVAASAKTYQENEQRAVSGFDDVAATLGAPDVATLPGGAR